MNDEKLNKWFHPLTLQSTPPLNWLRYAINQRANKCPMASCCCMEQQLSRSCSPEHKPKPFHIHALPHDMAVETDQQQVESWPQCYGHFTAKCLIHSTAITSHYIFTPGWGVGPWNQKTKTIAAQQQWTSHLQCSRLGRVRRRGRYFLILYSSRFHHRSTKEIWFVCTYLFVFCLFYYNYFIYVKFIIFNYSLFVESYI